MNNAKNASPVAGLSPAQQKLAYFLAIKKQGGLWRAFKWLALPSRCELLGHKPVKIFELNGANEGSRFHGKSVDVMKCSRCKCQLPPIVKAA